MALSSRFATIKAVGIDSTEEDTEEDDEVLQRLLGNKNRFKYSDPAKITFTGTSGRDGFASSDDNDTANDDCDDEMDPSWAQEFQSIMKKNRPVEDLKEKTSPLSQKVPSIDSDFPLHSLKNTLDRYNKHVQEVASESIENLVCDDKEEMKAGLSELRVLTADSGATNTCEMEQLRVQTPNCGGSDFVKACNQTVDSKDQELNIDVQADITDDTNNYVKQNECLSESMSDAGLAISITLTDSTYKGKSCVKNANVSDSHLFEDRNTTKPINKSVLADLVCLESEIKLIHDEKPENKQTDQILTTNKQETAENKKQHVSFEIVKKKNEHIEKKTNCLQSSANNENNSKIKPEITGKQKLAACSHDSKVISRVKKTVKTTGSLLSEKSVKQDDKHAKMAVCLNKTEVLTERENHCNTKAVCKSKELNITESKADSRHIKDSVTKSKIAEDQIHTSNSSHMTGRVNMKNSSIPKVTEERKVTCIVSETKSRELIGKRTDEFGKKNVESSGVNIQKDSGISSKEKCTLLKVNSFTENESKFTRLNSATAVKADTLESEIVNKSISGPLLQPYKSEDFKKSKTYTINPASSFPLDELLPVKKRRVSDDKNMDHSSNAPRKRHTSEMTQNKNERFQKVDEFWQASRLPSLSRSLDNNIFHGTVYVSPNDYQANFQPNDYLANFQSNDSQANFQADEYPSNLQSNGYQTNFQSNVAPSYEKRDPIDSSFTGPQEAQCDNRTFASQNLAYILSEIECGNQSVLSLIQDALNKQIGFNLEVLADKARKNCDPRKKKASENVNGPHNAGSFGFYTERRYEETLPGNKGDNSGVEQSEDLFRLFVQQCSDLVKTEEDRSKLQSLVKVLKSESGDNLTGTGFTPPDIDVIGAVHISPDTSVGITFTPPDTDMMTAYTPSDTNLVYIALDTASSVKSSHNIGSIMSGHSPGKSSCCSVSLTDKQMLFEGRTMLKGGVEPRHIPKTTVRKPDRRPPKDPRSKTYIARKFLQLIPMPTFAKEWWDKNEVHQTLSCHSSVGESYVIQDIKPKQEVSIHSKRNLKQRKVVLKPEKEDGMFHGSTNYQDGTTVKIGCNSEHSVSNSKSPPRQKYTVDVDTPVRDEHNVGICISAMSGDCVTSIYGKCQLPKATCYDLKGCRYKSQSKTEFASTVAELESPVISEESKIVLLDTKQNPELSKLYVVSSPVIESQHIPVLIRTKTENIPEIEIDEASIWKKNRNSVLRSIDLDKSHSTVEQHCLPHSLKVVGPCVGIVKPMPVMNSCKDEDELPRIAPSGTNTEIVNMDLDSELEDGEVESQSDNDGKKTSSKNKEKLERHTRFEKPVDHKRSKLLRSGSSTKKTESVRVSKLDENGKNVHIDDIEECESKVSVFKKFNLSLSEVSVSEFEEGQLLDDSVAEKIEQKKTERAWKSNDREKCKSRSYRPRTKHSSCSSVESKTSHRSSSKHESSKKRHKSSLPSSHSVHRDKKESKPLPKTAHLSEQSKDRKRHHTTREDYSQSENKRVRHDGAEQVKRRHSHGESRLPKDGVQRGADDMKKSLVSKNSMFKGKILLTSDRERDFSTNSLHEISSRDNTGNLSPFRNEPMPLQLSNSKIINVGHPLAGKSDSEIDLSDEQLSKEYQEKFCSSKNSSPVKKSQSKDGRLLLNDKGFLDKYRQKVTTENTCIEEKPFVLRNQQRRKSWERENAQEMEDRQFLELFKKQILGRSEKEKQKSSNIPPMPDKSTEQLQQPGPGNRGILSYHDMLHLADLEEGEL